MNTFGKLRSTEPSRGITLEDLDKAYKKLSEIPEPVIIHPVKVGPGWWKDIQELPEHKGKEFTHFFGMKVYLDESLPPFGWQICWGEK